MDPSGAYWAQVVVPVLIVVVMTGMGLELTPADFRRVLGMPRPVLVGLAGQMIALPAIGVLFATATGLSPELAIGVVIITACPGGAASNLFSYVADANIALSVTLTAVSTVLTLVTIPLWVGFGLERFLGADPSVALPLGRTLAQLFVVTLVPMAIGMGLRAVRPEQADRVRPLVKRAMTALFVIATATIVVDQWAVVARDASVAAVHALGLVVVALIVAHAGARLSGLDRRDAFTVSIEVGLQNGALATWIVIDLLARPELIVFPGTYALVAFGPVSLWTVAHRLRSPRR